MILLLQKLQHSVPFALWTQNRKETAMTPFRIGLYGCGRRTQAILERALASGTACVTRCHDINQKSAEELAVKYNAKTATLDELLSAEDVDMLLISLFPAAHPDALLKAVTSGKPIYIEKPVAVFPEDIRRLLPLCGKHYVHVGLSYRYIPVFRHLTDLVKSGKIGELTGINFNWLCKHHIPELKPGETPNWRHVPETGGELTQHYCHCFEWFRTLGGDFTQMTAMTVKRPENESCIEDIWDLIIKQKSGCQISFHSSECNPHFTVHGYLEGTKGSLSWEWNDPSTIVFYKNSLAKTEGEIIPVYKTIPDALEEFIERYREGKDPMVSLEDGLWAVLPPIFARESVATGKIASFPETLSDLKEI